MLAGWRDMNFKANGGVHTDREGYKRFSVTSMTQFRATCAFRRSTTWNFAELRVVQGDWLLRGFFRSAAFDAEVVLIRILGCDDSAVDIVMTASGRAEHTASG